MNTEGAIGIKIINKFSTCAVKQIEKKTSVCHKEGGNRKVKVKMREAGSLNTTFVV